MRPATILAFLTALLLALPAAAQSLAPAYPESGELNFTLLRNGSPLGTYTLRFEARRDGLHVDTKVRVDYRLVYITLYRFEQDRNEHWRDGELVNIQTRTNDNGDHFAMTAWSTKAGLEISGRDFKGVVPADTLPTGFWDIRTVERKQLFNSEGGGLLDISVENLGEDTIEAYGKPVRATHYRITGDTEKDLWYDEAGVWLGLQLIARDGSTIEYRLEAPDD